MPLTRTYRTRTCQCGREVKRLNRTAEGPLCGDCMTAKGLRRLTAPQYRSRAVRLEESLTAIDRALGASEAADLGEIEELAEEIGSWRDNMEGTGLENTSKFEEVGECADTLEAGKDELESAIEEYNGKLEEPYGGPDCSHCQGDCEEAEEPAKPEAAEGEPPAPPAEDTAEGEPEKICPEDCEHCREEGLEEAKEQVRQAASELESVDFPRMY